MTRPLLTILILFCALVSVARAQDEAQQVVVEDPFIEMRTGPAQAYPGFYVVDRGARIESNLGQ